MCGLAGRSPYRHVAVLFFSLLEPIRDLAKNWDIDVASALEDYLEELEGISITLGDELRSAVTDPLAGDDSDTVNFAEAALLIQVVYGASRHSRHSSTPVLVSFTPPHGDSHASDLCLKHAYNIFLNGARPGLRAHLQ